jgi:hypothetical protein
MIAIYNTNKMLSKELGKSFKNVNWVRKDNEKVVNGIEGLFIDWVPHYSKDKQALKIQTGLINKHVKQGVPTVIFDSKLSMTRKEYNLLSRKNVFFFEPALSYRIGFDYMPFWTKVKTIEEIELFEDNKNVDLGYVSISKEPNIAMPFEKYYTRYASKYYNRKVKHFSKLRNTTIHYQKDLKYRDIKCSVVINEPIYNSIGYIGDSVFKMMEQSCIPLIPEEHRYYHFLLDTVVKNEDNVEWYVENFDDLHLGVIYDINRKIENHFPEMKVEFVVDVIKNCIERK